MPPRDSTLGTFMVALVLCLVCSSIVAVAAVMLKPLQDYNKELDRKKNILLSAGLCEKSASAKDVDSVYEESIVARLVNLETGELVGEDIDPATYDAKKAAKDADLQVAVQPEGGLPGIKFREPYAFVYEIQKSGQTDGYILPIYGKGLWSTLYGFIAVGADRQTVRGITFYAHAETPGLGGEVDNQRWKDLWPGKQAYAENGDVALTVLKGKAEADDPHAVDGLSGATITTKGVDRLVQYWIGPDAFGRYLSQQ